MSIAAFAHVFDTIRGEFHSASRSLRASPGTTASVVLTLALVLGTNIAIFSLLSATGFRRLPFPDQDRVVYIWGQGVDSGLADRLAEEGGLLDGVATLRLRSGVVSGPIAPEQMSGLAVSSGLFSTLQVRPSLGRTFSDEEYQQDLPVVLVSTALWRRLYPEASVPSGQTVRVDGVSHTIVGVLPAGLETAFRTGVFPLLFPDRPGLGTSVGIMARLTSGAGPAALQARLDALTPISGAIDQQQAQVRSDIRFESVPVMLLGDSRQYLLMLQLCALAALLIGCANVANILLTRTLARRQEFTVRTALGAGRGAIARPMVIETALIGAMGGVGGLLFALGLLAWFRAGLPPEMIQHAAPIMITENVVLFTLVSTALAGVLFGLIPALLAGKLTGAEILRGGRTTTGERRSIGRFRTVLVGAEFALALGLVVSAGTVTETFMRLRPDNPGFDPSNKTVFSVQLPPERYAGRAECRLLLEDLAVDLQAIPGIGQVTYVSDLPIGGSYWVTSGRADDQEGGSSRNLYRFSARPDYLDIMTIPTVRGRRFAEAGAGEGLAWINETAAASLWPDTDPLGSWLLIEDPGGPIRLQVAGIVGDTRMSIASTKSRPAVYVPYGEISDRRATIVLVTSRQPEALARDVATVVASHDHELPVQGLATLVERLEEMTRYPAFAMQAIALSALLALLLAIIGLFGLVSFSTRLRTQEFGIRLALGAVPTDVLRYVLSRSMRLAATGSIAGILFSVWLHAGLRSRLIGIQGMSPGLVAAAVTVMTLVALLASWMPAWRAAWTDPLEVMKTG
jgi:predicted permease